MEYYTLINKLCVNNEKQSMKSKSICKKKEKKAWYKQTALEKAANNHD